MYQKYSYMIAYEASQEEIEAKEQLTQAETTTAAEAETTTAADSSKKLHQRQRKRKRQLQRAKQKQLQADQSLFYRQQKRRLKRETALM